MWNNLVSSAILNNNRGLHFAMTVASLGLLQIRKSGFLQLVGLCIFVRHPSGQWVTMIGKCYEQSSTVAFRLTLDAFATYQPFYQLQ